MTFLKSYDESTSDAGHRDLFQDNVDMSSIHAVYGRR